jgi:hypothetical protein
LKTDLTTVTETDNRESEKWYVRYENDAYAMGPLEFSRPVNANIAVEDAVELFGYRPAEVWPEGKVEEVEEYEYELDRTI